MVLNILHTISGLLIIIFFIGKVILHYYLDYKYNRNISFLYSLATPMQYFRPYKRMVDDGLLRLQRICNLFLTFTLIAIVLNILLGIGIYFIDG
jgi:succinate dehydrogenase/fumarate reductase cytochrome b subunit